MKEQQISVEEIMKTIKEEVQRRKVQQKQKVAPTMNSLTEEFYIAPIKLSVPEQRIEIKNSYNINELLVFHDAEFIKNAYRAILRREPDPEGYEYYLNALRNGKLSKIGIVIKLRYSPEGREKKVKIKGLISSYVISCFKGLPIIKYIVKSSDVLLLREYFQLQQNMLLTIENRINKLINQLNQKINIINSLQIQLEKQQKEINQKIKTYDFNIINQQRRITMLLKKINGNLNEPNSLESPQKDILSIKRDQCFDAMYVSLENHFRGTRDIVKKRLEVYIPYVKKTLEKTGGELILDVGCGRGEWLELLKENGIQAIGIDINMMMIEQCNRLNLNVIESDAIEYLRTQKNNTFAIITGFHIVEHLPLNNMITLFDECFRVLIPGGMVIFETPNPKNLIVGACNFYSDPTHNNPCFPETLQFLLEFKGFTDVSIEYLNPIEGSPFNLEIEKEKILHNWFFSARDFAILAYKP